MSRDEAAAARAVCRHFRAQHLRIRIRSGRRGEASAHGLGASDFLSAPMSRTADLRKTGAACRDLSDPSSQGSQQKSPPKLAGEFPHVDNIPIWPWVKSQIMPPVTSQSPLKSEALKWVVNSPTNQNGIPKRLKTPQPHGCFGCSEVSEPRRTRSRWRQAEMLLPIGTGSKLQLVGSSTRIPFLEIDDQGFWLMIRGSG